MAAKQWRSKAHWALFWANGYEVPDVQKQRESICKIKQTYSITNMTSAITKGPGSGMPRANNPDTYWFDRLKSRWSRFQPIDITSLYGLLALLHSFVWLFGLLGCWLLLCHPRRVVFPDLSVKMMCRNHADPSLTSACVFSFSSSCFCLAASHKQKTILT